MSSLFYSLLSFLPSHLPSFNSFLAASLFSCFRSFLFCSYLLFFLFFYTFIMIIFSTRTFSLLPFLPYSYPSYFIPASPFVYFSSSVLNTSGVPSGGLLGWRRPRGRNHCRRDVTGPAVVGVGLGVLSAMP